MSLKKTVWIWLETVGDNAINNLNWFEMLLVLVKEPKKDPFTKILSNTTLPPKEAQTKNY